MSKLNLFLDSSALFAGIASETGAARVLLLLAESEHINLTISEQVVAETERAIAKKVPQALNDLRQAILASKTRIVRDPSLDEVMQHLDLISHSADVPIILAAMQDKVDYLVTLNRKHFMDDPGVAQRTRLRIGTPGEALSWVRKQLSTKHITEQAVDLGKSRQLSLLVLKISPEWIALLMEVGVETVDELAQCNVKNLFNQLKTANEEKRIVRKLPGLTQVEEWVNKAKKTRV
jgi:predicted nucleic acid-binding protein